ncbi:MAG: phosphatase PAP2 family protein [Acidimicrobiales bacterium]
MLSTIPVLLAPATVSVLPPRGLNTSVYLDINHFARQTAWAHTFMHNYALWLGPVLLTVLFLLAYALAWWRRQVAATSLLVLGGIGTLIALGLNQLVAHGAGELRPYDTLRHVLVLVPKANDFSFPSDHSVIAGALVTSVVLVVGRYGRRSIPVALAACSAVLGLFLCFARVYVGAHYPGDVVAGLLLGVVVVGLVSLLRPLAYAVAAWLDRTPLGLVVSRPPAGDGLAGVAQPTDGRP